MFLLLVLCYKPNKGIKKQTKTKPIMITSIGQPQQNLSNSEMETAPYHMIIVSTQGNHDNEEFGVVI